MLSGPEKPSTFATLGKLWLDASPPSEAFVLSPFFDPPQAVPNTPAIELWKLLKQRGEATVQFAVTVEDVPGENAVHLHAPESLKRAQPANRSQCKTEFTRLQLDSSRPLHAKCLRLQNDHIILYMAGSSNFTSAGTGAGTVHNLEANLAFVVGRQNKSSARTMLQAWLLSEEIPENVERRFEPRPDDDKADTKGGLLPSVFDQATFRCDEAQSAFVELTFNRDSTAPEGWSLYIEDKQQPFFQEAEWRGQDRPAKVSLPWSAARPPSELRVSWLSATGCAWWPVNVSDSRSLPPPAELRDLPLEVLIDILTSAKPLHQTLQEWLRRQKERSPHTDTAALDPLKRVDTTSFLLQRTRRVSDALTALRQRLERPVLSEQALLWRLHGPVGVMALAQALVKEAHSEQECCFLLTELCLELARVQSQTAPGTLTPEFIRTKLRETANEIRSKIPSDALADMPTLAEYIRKAFEKVML